MSHRLIEWCKGNIIWTNIIVISFLIIIAMLIWFSGEWLWSGNVVTFGPLHSYIFTWLAILIASIAATNTVLASIATRDSLTVTRQSLELTRNTLRPFLTTVYDTDEPQIIIDKGNARIRLHVQNTGSLPADDVSVSCFLYTAVKKEEVKELGLAQDEARHTPSIFFPGVEIDYTFHLGTQEFKEYLKGQNQVHVRIEYKNVITGKQCITEKYFVYEPLTKTPLSPINFAHKLDRWE